MGAWIIIGLLAAGLLAITSRAAFRRYQDFRIRQHKRRIAWAAYKQSRGGPR